MPYNAVCFPFSDTCFDSRDSPLRVPVLGPIAINSYPLRNALVDKDTEIINFSLVDTAHYRAKFSITIDTSPYTNYSEYPSVTSFRFLDISTDNFTYRYAVGQPLIVYQSNALYQCFRLGASVVDGFMIPGILRAPLNLTHVPAGYPMLPPPTTSIADTADPLWSAVTPSNRLTGAIRFCSIPVGISSGNRIHNVESIFADELAQDAYMNARDGTVVPGEIE